MLGVEGCQRLLEAVEYLLGATGGCCVLKAVGCYWMLSKVAEGYWVPLEGVGGYGRLLGVSFKLLGAVEDYRGPLEDTGGYSRGRRLLPFTATHVRSLQPPHYE